MTPKAISDDGVWASALAVVLAREQGFSEPCMWIPAAARYIREDLNAAGGDRATVGAAWRFRLGLPTPEVTM